MAPIEIVKRQTEINIFFERLKSISLKNKTVKNIPRLIKPATIKDTFD